MLTPRCEGQEIGINGRVIWRAVAYGGALAWLWVGGI